MIEEEIIAETALPDSIMLPDGIRVTAGHSRLTMQDSSRVEEREKSYLPIAHSDLYLPLPLPNGANTNH